MVVREIHRLEPKPSISSKSRGNMIRCKKTVPVIVNRAESGITK